MGGCAGKESSPYDEFSVTNINDQHRLVHSGVMYVTETNLIYIDKKSHEKWEWPLKFLRRYGCEGFVFSFEAGRKCPSGEGLYAFNCKKANALFNRVAQNISQGNLEPTEPDLPERNADVPFLPKLQQPSQPQQSATLPNGNVRLSSSSIQPMPPMSLPTLPPPLPPTPPPNNQPNSRPGGGSLQYSHLEFEKGHDNRPTPMQEDKVNYTEIDMTKTNEISRLVRIKDEFHSNGGITRRKTTSNATNKKKGKTGSRSSSCSSSSSLNPEQVRFRSLDEGSKGGTRGSAPDIRNTTQKMSPPLLPTTAEALVERDPSSPHHKSTSFINEPNYLNISVGNNTGHGNEDQHTYSNMTIGTGVTPTADQPVTEQNYANISVGMEEHNYTNVSVGTGPNETTEIITPTNPSPVNDLEHNYTNLTIGSGVATPIVPSPAANTEHNYTNITVGGDHDDSQSNYQNLIPGQGLVSSTPVTSPTVHQPVSSNSPESPSFVKPFRGVSHSVSGVTSHTSQTLPAIKDGGGANNATYIELDMSSTSAQQMGSYAELEISGNQNLSLVSPQPDGKRQRSISAITNLPPPTSSSSTAAYTSNDGILYQQLNFTEMEAIRSLVLTRQHEKEEAPPTSHSSVEKTKSKK